MLQWFLTLDLFDGPARWVVYAVAAVCGIALLIRPPRRPWLTRAVPAVVIGAALGFGIELWCDKADVFGVLLPRGLKPWTMMGGALIALAAVSFARARPWRRVVAGLALLAAPAMMIVGIDNAFGLTRTPAAILGVNVLPAPPSLAAPRPAPPTATPLSESWRAPADMPARGRTYALKDEYRIPSTGGFAPRDGSIYLPPAALVKDPPALPVMVLMMGLPGSPDPTDVAGVVDAFAGAHHGLGPIVVLADQLGAPLQNPACVDSDRFGGVETYLNVDVPAFIRSHLRVLPDSRSWTIAGYSNGGACAFLYAARHPDIWGNVATTSAEPWAGFADPDTVLGPVYRGDKALFDANKPSAVLSQHSGAYAGHEALFAAGELDARYAPPNRVSADQAAAAGFRSTFYLIPGAGHTGAGLYGGLAEALRVLSPRWGLTPR